MTAAADHLRAVKAPSDLLQYAGDLNVRQCCFAWGLGTWPSQEDECAVDKHADEQLGYGLLHLLLMLLRSVSHSFVYTRRQMILPSHPGDVHR